MELTIKLDLTEETLDMIKGFLNSLSDFKAVATAEPKTKKEVEQVTAQAVEKPKAKEQTAEPTEQEQEQEQAAPITLSDLRQIFTSIAEAGGREKIRELLNELGVKKITEIAEERYTEVYKALEKIANELPAPF